MAYLMILIAVWLLGDTLKDFDHPENSSSKLLFYVACGLLTLILAVIVVGGVNMGMFTSVGNETTNGIAHFGGFMTGLIVFLVYDAATEARRFFQITFGIAIVMGLLWYRQYLLLLIQLPRG
jgi:TRAP-type C4-dicarboxylate transport system permease large subunit